MKRERYAQVKQLFIEAGKLSLADRESFLSQACGDDDELREEVENLLAHDSSETIIRNDGPGKPNRSVGGESASPSLVRKLRGYGVLTKYLSPRAHLAIGAFLATAFLLVFAFLMQRSIHSFQQRLRTEAFHELLNAKVTGLELWMMHERATVESWCRSHRLRQLTEQLVQLAATSNNLHDDLAKSPVQQELRDELRAIAGVPLKYAIWDRRFVTVADWSPDNLVLGRGVTPFGAGILSSVFDGKTELLQLGEGDLISKDYPTHLEKPKLVVFVPVRDHEGAVIAAMMVFDLDRTSLVNQILSLGQISQSGETYVFDKDGLMLSESRFNDQLREIGLIPNEPDSHSSKVVVLRDPGGDMTAGYRPLEPLATRPLTKMARNAVAGQDGVDLDGYRDYRGVKVVGAWRWLDEYKIGVATELDADEMEPGLQTLLIGAWVGFGMLALFVGITVHSYYSIHRLRRQVGEQYTVGQHMLEEQIGEGGMGRVFKARHALLKRPTAVKLLRPELLDQESIARFAREAQLASQLSHPNTIDVYDYGVTSEGLFYFVMEYVDGLSLMQLVQVAGALPATRAVHLLRQMCGSLCEAHAMGMIHHDIKPQNVMVYCPGGKPDFVKVLDFGLAKHAETPKSRKITRSGMLSGTPLYIAPERIQHPHETDARVDIYSFGAVAFYMLTGHEVFQGDSIADILLQVANTPPPRPSEYVEVPPQLDQLVFDCLAKDPDRRPQSVAEIRTLLYGMDGLEPWREDQARMWWKRHEEVQNGTCSV